MQRARVDVRPWRTTAAHGRAAGALTNRHAPPLPHRGHHEAGDYGEALLTLLEAGQALDGPLAGAAAAPALRGALQRHYLETLQRLDGALRRCCGAFSAEAYSKARARRGCLRDGRRCCPLPGGCLAPHLASDRRALLPQPPQLLEGYLLQGAPPPALAAKVAAAFSECLHDAAMRVVRRGEWGHLAGGRWRATGCGCRCASDAFVGCTH